jgi:hypothetical protein
MMPAWMVWSLVVLNCCQSIGWGYTIRKSMSRGLAMWELGRQVGDDQGWKRSHAQAMAAVQTRKANRLSKRWR